MAVTLFDPTLQPCQNIARRSEVRPRMTPFLRVAKRVLNNDPSACWTWPGAVSDEGYGRISVDGKHRYVHRIVMETTIGRPLAESEVVDHQCHNESDCAGGVCEHRRCCNPRHLRVVTRAENNRSGKSWAGKNARKTHCVHGHEFTEGNTNTVFITRVKKGKLIVREGRQCKTCMYAFPRSPTHQRTVPLEGTTP